MPTIESAPSQQLNPELNNAQTPLERYQAISHELARTLLAKEQIEDRERELRTAQLLAKNACIMQGIENPTTTPMTAASDQAAFEACHDETIVGQRSAT
ncbi:MAG: hypothetical protein LC687_06685 [Actinobacteria bacterium]|nr:hypothetical protein [Actinomycetota bacterium]